MVFSLVQADQRLPLCLRNGRSLCRLALCAVGEPDAGSDGIRIDILPRSCQQDAVILCHVPSGGDDLMGKLSVVGEQQQTGGILVQPSHRPQILPAQLRRNQLHDAVLSRLIRRADIPLRLVQKHV